MEFLQGESEFPNFRFRSSNIRRKSSSHGVSLAKNLVTKNRFASKDRFASNVLNWDNNKNEKIFWKFISVHLQFYFVQFYMDLERIIYIIWVFHDAKMSLFELNTSIVWCNSWESIIYIIWKKLYIRSILESKPILSIKLIQMWNDDSWSRFSV